MKRTVILWIVAFILTAASAVYQRVTGPTYPLSGNVTLAGTQIKYKLLRSQGGDEDALVRVEVPDPAINGVVHWRRYKTDDPWSVIEMKAVGGALEARLPHQPPAGKLQYMVILMKGGQSAILPNDRVAVLRYKGDVPTAVLIVHVFAMFAAMLLSARAGLEFFNPNPRFMGLIAWTIGFLAFGGLVMGPIVQKYAFDAYWTGWPFGTDLTDNKTFVGLLAWVAAAIAIRKSAKPRVWALGASVFLFVIYLIPHSVLGSELDYSKQKQQTVELPDSSKK
jgi:hypothetical protein